VGEEVEEEELKQAGVESGKSEKLRFLLFYILKYSTVQTNTLLVAGVAFPN